MFVREREHGDIAGASVMARGVIREVVKPLMPYEIYLGEGYYMAELLAKQGFGTIVTSNHFCQRDQFDLIGGVVGTSQTFMLRELVIPIASDHYHKALGIFGQALGTNIIPVLNPYAKQRQNETNGRRVDSSQASREGFLKYVEKTLAVLERGGLAIITPQATRKDHLIKGQNIKPIELILSRASRKGITNISILIAGIGLKDAPHYNLDMFGGMNLGKTTVIRVGDCLTLSEIFRTYGTVTGIDDQIMELLRGVVPTEYLSPPPGSSGNKSFKKV